LLKSNRSRGLQPSSKTGWIFLSKNFWLRGFYRPILRFVAHRRFSAVKSAKQFDWCFQCRGPGFKLSLQREQAFSSSKHQFDLNNGVGFTDNWQRN